MIPQTALKTLSLSLLAVIFQSMSSMALAQDPRIQIVPYEADRVIKFYGCTTLQTMISFDADERIENVAVGDSQLWQVTPNKKADLLFVKALTTNGRSNMTVVTNQHHYIFDLRNATVGDCNSGRTAYELRFSYPQREITVEQALSGEALLPLPEKRHSAYTYQGDVTLVPLRVFDDGTSTYMMWSDGVSTPAVFVRNGDGSESLVNFSNIGSYFVIDQLASAFSLRLGSQSAIVFNDAYKVKGLDDLSPKPKPTGKR